MNAQTCTKFKLISALIMLLPITLWADDRVATACGHPDYPPINWHDGVALKGVAKDTLEQILSELDIKLEAVNTNTWARCLKEVESGSVDFVVSAYATEERKVYAEFSETPLSVDRKSVFVMKGKEFQFNSWNDLKGMSTAFVSGVSFGNEFDQFLDDNVTIYQVSYREQYFRMLESNRIDFFPTGEYIGLINALQFGYEGRVVPLKNPISEGYLHIGVSKKSKYLDILPQINSLLQQKIDSGVVERLKKQHLQGYVISTK